SEKIPDGETTLSWGYKQAIEAAKKADGPIEIVRDGYKTVLDMWLAVLPVVMAVGTDRKSTRLNSSHVSISYAVFCLKKKKCTCKPYHTEREEHNDKREKQGKRSGSVEVTSRKQ